MDADFATAIKKYNNFKKIVSISKNVVVFEKENGKLYLAVASKETVALYAKSGKCFSHISFKTPILEMPLECLVRVGSKLKQHHGGKTAARLYMKINKTVAEWHN